MTHSREAVGLALAVLLASTACDGTSLGIGAGGGTSAPRLQVGEFVLDSVEAAPRDSVFGDTVDFGGWLRSVGSTPCAYGEAADTAIFRDGTSLVVRADSTLELRLMAALGTCYLNGEATAIDTTGGIYRGVAHRPVGSISDTFAITAESFDTHPVKLVVDSQPPVKLLFHDATTEQDVWLWFIVP